jgi:GAF domain-containing protein
MTVSGTASTTSARRIVPSGIPAPVAARVARRSDVAGDPPRESRAADETLLTTLVQRTTELVPSGEVAVVLVDDDGAVIPRMTTTTSRARALAEAQLRVREGPMIDCLRTEYTVGPLPFATARGRWPTVTTLALQNGLGGVLAVPMRVNRGAIGALGVLHPTGYVERRASTVRTLEALADAAAIALEADRATRVWSDRVTQLQTALSSRIVIEQAKGMVAETLDVSIDEAFEVIRRFARGNNLRIDALCQAIIHRAVRAEVLAAPR